RSWRIHLCTFTWLAALPLRQAKVLEFVLTYSRENGASPTVREVMAFLGVRTPRGALIHLQALTKKGFLKHTPRIARGYRAANEGSPAAAVASPPSDEERSHTQNNTARAGAGDHHHEVLPLRSPRKVNSSEARIPILGRVPAGGPSVQDEDFL